MSTILKYPILWLSVKTDQVYFYLCHRSIYWQTIQKQPNIPSIKFLLCSSVCLPPSLSFTLSMASQYFYSRALNYINIEFMEARAFGLWVEVEGKLNFNNRTMLQIVLTHEWRSWSSSLHRTGAYSNMLKWKCFCSEGQMTKNCGWFLSGKDKPLRGEKFCAAVVKTKNLKALEYVSEDEWQMFLRNQWVAEAERAL